ncbi:MAG: hypothetical protein HY238_21190 [Acidobacteria bacterium]|nr:hypothetical protein [Acidobacteriota bacterium]
MINFTIEHGNPVCVAELKDRFGIYLDSDSLFELAEGAASRRQRFIEAVKRRGTLLFSLTNAAELAGPQGKSADAVRAFLDSLGPCWVPLELNPWKVVEREQAGLTGRAPVSETFMEAYVQRRTYDLSAQGGRVLDLSAENFFRLGAVLDWAQESRNEIQRDALTMDDTLRSKVQHLRAEYDKDLTCLDRALPSIPYDERRPATFVLLHLLRTLVLEAKGFRYMPHDALDFCHAVLASAYGSLAALDKHWKRRVENLPRPSRLAKVYYRPQANELVDTLEALVTTS